MVHHSRRQRLELLRADLYRLLDDVARARGGRCEAAALRFEQAWDEFRALATRRRARPTHGMNPEGR